MTKILIADDHAVVRHGVREILARAFDSLQIVEAKDSREALQALMEEEFDLVLLDINMPGRSGLDILEESRRLHPKTPVLVLSAYAEEQFALRAFKYGAAGYLNKQSAFDELITAVKRVLAGGKYVTSAWAEKIVNVMGNDFQQEPHEALSNREFQVLRMVAQGKSAKEIAVELALSEKTVGVYRSRIGEKMGMSTNVELTRYALQHKLVD